MDFTDKARDIRKGEELDTDKVEAYLRDVIPGLEGDLVIKQFPGGHSNLTYQLSIGEQDFVLRRPPFGTKAKTAHDMNREFRILTVLREVFPYCPEPVAYTGDDSVMGCPFYVMKRIRGIIIRRNLPSGLDLTREQMRRIFDRLVDVHVELHAIDYRSIGLGDFGKPEGYVQRQVRGWSDRYRKARTPDAPDCEEVMAWLAEKMPPESGEATIIHNDYRLDNVVLDAGDPTKIIGVLDWEMATIGDPLMDLGCSLPYYGNPDDPEEELLMRSMLMPTLEGMITREELVDLYAEKSGRSIDRVDFYCAFGLFRLGVIIQQIYYRYYHGQTQDERFKNMVLGVTILDRAARRVIEKSNR